MKEKVEEQEALGQAYGELADTSRSVDDEIDQSPPRQPDQYQGRRFPGRAQSQDGDSIAGQRYRGASLGAMTRRRFLALLAAGGAVPLVGCGQSAPPPSGYAVPGTVVNGGLPAGHILRRAASLEPPPPVGEWDAVVVGGGVSGLCACWKLRRAGVQRILLLELESQWGGTSIAGTAAGRPFPWGAHYINVPPAEADCIHELLGAIGIIEGYDSAGRPQVDPRHLLRWPHERLHRDGAWFEGFDLLAGASRAEAEALRAFEDDMLRWALYRGRDGRKAFAMPLQYSSAAAEARALDDITMAQYLQDKGMAGSRLQWLVNYACRDDYGSSFDQVSAWAAIHYFACRYYDRRLEDQYPADTLTWPEGNAFLVDRIISQLAGIERRLNAAVVRLVNKGAAVECAFAELPSGQMHSVAARTVVYAGKLHGAPYVVPQMPQGQKRAIAALEYSPWLVAAIRLEQLPQVGRGLAWDNVFFDSPSLGYIVADHQRTASGAGGAGVIVYYRPFVDDLAQSRAALLEFERQYWIDQIMAELLAVHPELTDKVERIDFYLWGHGMVRPAPGGLWGPFSGRRRQPVDRLFFAGCDATGLPLFEEAAFCGIWAAEQALARLDLPFATSLGGLPRD